nr:hypothetical protein [Candidatus Cloacimonadota bacterium]
MTISDFKTKGFQSIHWKHIFSLRRVFTLIILILAISQLSAFDRLIRVGVYQNPPKIFVDDHGKPAGIFVDIITEIAQREDWELEWHYGTWEENLRLLAAGELDLMPDMAYDENRAKLYDFHKNAVLLSFSELFSRKDIKIQTYTDLDGLTIALLKNSVQENILEDTISGLGIQCRFLRFDSLDEVFDSVADKRADLAITNIFYGRMNAREHQLVESPLILNPSNLYFASPKGKNQEILQAIDQHIELMKSDPESIYFSSLRHWSPEAQKWELPMWLLITMLLLGVTFGVAIIGSFILRHQVNLRTQELQKANQQMELKVEERTEELGFALREAQVADMLKSAFLANMSHELRTPLNSIIGFTGILLQKLPGELNSEQERMLTIIQNSSRHLLALINDVLDISKIEAEQLELKLSEVNLQASLEKVVSLVSLQAKEKGLDLKLEMKTKNLFIKVDQRRFEQVLLNLLINAIKFTDKGFVRLICKQEGNILRITVQDTGIGIPKDKFDVIFAAFQQIDTGLNRKYEGTGLGLSISQKLIRLMGGDITIESEIDKGTSFHICLPLDQEGHDG